LLNAEPNNVVYLHAMGLAMRKVGRCYVAEYPRDCHPLVRAIMRLVAVMPPKLVKQMKWAIGDMEVRKYNEAFTNNHRSYPD
jgi:hypothetical protein